MLLNLECITFSEFLLIFFFLSVFFTNDINQRLDFFVCYLALWSGLLKFTIHVHNFEEQKVSDANKITQTKKIRKSEIYSLQCHFKKSFPGKHNVVCAINFFFFSLIELLTHQLLDGFFLLGITISNELKFEYPSAICILFIYHGS